MGKITRPLRQSKNSCEASCIAHNFLSCTLHYFAKMRSCPTVAKLQDRFAIFFLPAGGKSLNCLLVCESPTLRGKAEAFGFIREDMAVGPF